MQILFFNLKIIMWEEFVLTLDLKSAQMMLFFVDFNKKS